MNSHLPDLAAGIVKEVQNNLLIWFDSHARDLPWRLTPSHYGTWISEIMLQQTTVKTVIPYWKEFMFLFPDVESLALASESEVLSAWSGLGFYRRASNLHKAARLIVKNHNGELPRNRKQWQAMPGVGTYASGAIASIALGQVVPAIDGNAKRVLSRLVFSDPELCIQTKPSELERIANQLVHKQRPGRWNEAIMELGAKICRPSEPKCSECPVFDYCKAGPAGMTDQIPPTKKKLSAVAISLATIVVQHKGHYLLLAPGQPVLVGSSNKFPIGRSDTSGLHKGLWTIPTSAWFHKSGPSDEYLTHPGFVNRWFENSPLGVQLFPFVKSVRLHPSFSHHITHYRLKVYTWRVTLAENGQIASLLSPPEEGFCKILPLLNFEENVAIFSDLSGSLPISKLVAKSVESKLKEDD
ncbi:MAG: A/G-specific adenine glycosylase [bacterium]|nr:A/G-specific adenine glycosylase [bacterium]